MSKINLFRGQKHDTKEWVYGDLLHIAGGCIIYHGSQTECTCKQNEGAVLELFSNEISVVIPDTVGQFTGVKDKNGVKIFENHIVKYQIQLESEDPKEIGGEVLECNHKVIFNLHGCGFEISCLDYATMNQGLYCNNHMEIVGNIFDNAEMVGSF